MQTSVAPRVLLVDNCDDVRMTLTELLDREGFSVIAVSSGEEALAVSEAQEFDAVILEVALPGIDGFETCRRLRERSDAHVLILSVRTDEVDKIVAFATGADDYVDKPYSPRELVARLHAAMRRRSDPVRDRLRLGALHIDVGARTASVRQLPVQLTRIEFDLLLLMARHAGVVVSRTDLLAAVWGPSWVGSGSDHLVEVHVSNLRRKLVAAGGTGIVRTVRQMGYRIDAGLRASA